MLSRPHRGGGGGGGEAGQMENKRGNETNQCGWRVEGNKESYEV